MNRFLCALVLGFGLGVLFSSTSSQPPVDFIGKPVIVGNFNSDIDSWAMPIPEPPPEVGQSPTRAGIITHQEAWK